MPTRGSGVDVPTVTVSVTSEPTLSGFAESVMCGCVTLDMRRVTVFYHGTRDVWAKNHSLLHIALCTIHGNYRMLVYY